MDPGLSVVIPTWNEAEVIAHRVAYLLRHGADEVVVADGGSTDGTAAFAKAAGAVVVAAPKGRARQMNAGAATAGRRVLYFLHADTLPPPTFRADIHAAIHSGRPAGCYRLAFDDPHPLLRFSAWLTRFDVDAVRFGDQSLFVTREVFDAVGGFRTDRTLMEDQDIVIRIRKLVPFALMAGEALTSARRYRANGVVRLQLLFTAIWLRYQWGADDATLTAFYRKHIRG